MLIWILYSLSSEDEVDLRAAVEGDGQSQAKCQEFGNDAHSRGAFIRLLREKDQNLFEIFLERRRCENSGPLEHRLSFHPRSSGKESEPCEKLLPKPFAVIDLVLRSVLNGTIKSNGKLVCLVVLPGAADAAAPLRIAGQAVAAPGF